MKQGGIMSLSLTVFTITSALLGLFFVFLSYNVIRHRLRAQVVLGDNDDSLLRYSIRAHGNFAEYVPFALLLLFLDYQVMMPVWLMIVLCLGLLIGRALHAMSLLKYEPKDASFVRFRVNGIMLTFIVISVASLYLIAQLLIGLFI